MVHRYNAEVLTDDELDIIACMRDENEARLELQHIREIEQELKEEAKGQKENYGVNRV